MVLFRKITTLPFTAGISRNKGKDEKHIESGLQGVTAVGQ
jgi:hypothetical protein